MIFVFYNHCGTTDVNHSYSWMTGLLAKRSNGGGMIFYDIMFNLNGSERTCTFIFISSYWIIIYLHYLINILIFKVNDKNEIEDGKTWKWRQVWRWKPVTGCRWLKQELVNCSLYLCSHITDLKSCSPKHEEHKHKINKSCSYYLPKWQNQTSKAYCVQCVSYFRTQALQEGKFCRGETTWMEEALRFCMYQVALQGSYTWCREESWETYRRKMNGKGRRTKVAMA